MRDSGFIALNRKILNFEFYQDSNTFRLFFHLLLKVNFADTRYKGKLVKRGSIWVTNPELQRELGLTRQQIRTSLNKLQEGQYLTTKTTNRETLVTIDNYNTWSPPKREKNQLNNHQITIKQPSNNHQITSVQKNKGTREQRDTAATTHAREESLEPQLTRLCQFYEANNFGVIAPSIFEEMQGYLSRGVDAELIERCMKEAVDSGATNWRYAKSILKRCETSLIKTVSDFEADQKKRQDRSTGRDNAVTYPNASGNPFLRDDL